MNTPLSPLRSHSNRAIHSRLCAIHAILLKETYPSKSYLAERFGIAEVTIERDLNQLRDDYAAPLEYCRKNRGYYYTEKYDGLAIRQLDERQKIAMFLAGEILQSNQLYESGQSVHQLIQKTNSQYPDKFTIYSEKIKEHISCGKSEGAQISEEQIITLINALIDYEPIEFVYTKPDQEQTKRKVHPYHLSSIDGDWYLTGHCETRNDIRQFKVLRMTELKQVPGEFYQSPNFDIKNHTDLSMGSFIGKSTHSIEIKLSKKATQHLEEKQIHSTQRLKIHKDGTSTLKLEVNNLIDIQRWILSWGEHATALAPQELVNNIKQQLKKIINSYDL